MDIHFEDISLKAGENSFVAYSFESNGFPFYIHYHPEYELTYIDKGSGQRIIGNVFEHYSTGDLVLVAPNIPHTWIGNEMASRVTVIQFSEEFLATLTAFRELIGSKRLMEATGGALVFDSKLVAKDIKRISSLNGLDKFTCLLEILNKLSMQPAKRISTSGLSFSRETESRINKVCGFIQQNIHRPLTLSEIAGLIYMTDSAFCKFFRKATGKTLTEYINLVRIESVSNRLLYTDLPVYQIASEYGYESQTYFNKIFRKLKGCSPTTFRKLIKDVNETKDY